MITDAIIAALVGVMNGLYALLPSWEIDVFTIQGQAAGSLNDFEGTSIGGLSPAEVAIMYMRKLNWIFPFDQLVIIVNLALTLYLAVMGYRAIKYVIGIIRGAGTN